MPKRAEFRNPANYYLAQASDIASPALRMAGSLIAGAPTAKGAWHKGLIISHTHIGDLLYRTASVPFLGEAFPNCSWDYLASPSSAGVLEGCPSIANVLPFVQGENSWDLGPGAFVALRDKGYDVALCTNSLRHYPDLMLAVALGIPNRVAYGGRGFSGLVTRPISITRPQPFPAYFREMVSQLSDAPGEWSLRPQLTITADHRAKANAFLATFADGDATLVACCPTTRQQIGRWPANFFIDPLNRVAETKPIRVLVCGASSERSELERIAENISAPTWVMAGDLDLLSFGALLARCKVALTQDSASRHIANAVGTPVLYFRNLAVDAIETGSYCDSETDLAPGDHQLLTDAETVSVQQQVSVEMMASKLSALTEGNQSVSR